VRCFVCLLCCCCKWVGVECSDGQQYIWVQRGASLTPTRFQKIQNQLKDQCGTKLSSRACTASGEELQRLLLSHNRLHSAGMQLHQHNQGRTLKGSASLYPASLLNFLEETKKMLTLEPQATPPSTT
jgi:hypothetical protein